jgi:hypothetical protein
VEIVPQAREIFLGVLLGTFQASQAGPFQFFCRHLGGVDLISSNLHPGVDRVLYPVFFDQTNAPMITRIGAPIM